MKAIVRIPTAKRGYDAPPLRSTYDLVRYLLTPEKSGSGFHGDRVAFFIGDLGGYGFPMRNAATMAEALEAGHDDLKGRPVRHIVLSAEKGLPPDEQREAFARLKASAPLLARELGADRWLGMAHADTECPHVQIAFANYDSRKNRRLNINPDFLKRLQDMEWTPHFESGRGSRKEKGKRGKQIAKEKENGESKRNEKKAGIVGKLVSFLREKKAPKMDKEKLAEWLFSHPELPSGWDRSRLRSKAGNAIKNAAIIIDGEGLRLARFFETRRREKDKNRQHASGEILLREDDGMGRSSF